MRIDGTTVARLVHAVENNQASDDSIICIQAEGEGPAVPLTTHEGEPLRLGHLRGLARSFSFWMGE